MVEAMQRSIVWRTVAVSSCLLALGGSAACSRDLSELHQRQADWKRAEIVDYNWALKVTEPLFGSRTLVVEVRDGRPKRVVIDGRVVSTGQVDFPLTVDALYEQMRDSAESAAVFEVQWDQDLPYASSIRLDESDAHDDEVTYQVVRFMPTGS